MKESATKIDIERERERMNTRLEDLIVEPQKVLQEKETIEKNLVNFT